jgi:hypothetical protein
MSTEQAVQVDGDKLMQFVFCAVDELGPTLIAALVVMGDKLGLYRALAGSVHCHLPHWPTAPEPPRRHHRRRTSDSRSARTPTMRGSATSSPRQASPGSAGLPRRRSALCARHGHDRHGTAGG